MAETKVGILLEVQDKATSALNSVSGSLDNMAGRAKAMQPAFEKIALAGTVAFGAISAVAFKAIKDYAEVETANSKLEHAVLAVSKGTKEQLAAMEDLIEVQEKKGVVDADALKVGVAQLSTFGLTSNMVKQLIPSLADLAVNQYGVAVTSEQMNDTANVMAKALNGQFGILEKSGIRFTETQQKMIEFGTETQRITALQQGLAQNLKFTNESAAATSEGGMQRLKVQLGNVSEALGKSLMPLLNNLVERVKPIIEKVAAWIEKNPELTTKIIMVSAAVAGLLVVVGTLGVLLPAIIAGFGFLVSPVGLVVIAIAGLVAVGIWLYKNWEEIEQKATQIWGSIAAFFTSIWNTITGTVKGAVDEILFRIEDTFWLIEWKIRTAFEAVLKFLGEIWNGITEVFKFAVAFIAGLVIVAFEAMGIDIVKVINDMYNGIVAFWESTKAAFGIALQFIKDLWNTVWSAVKEVFIGTWNEISAVFNTVMAVVSSVWQTVWTAFKDFISPVVNAIKNVVTGLWSWLKGIFESASKPVSNAWSSMWDSLTSAATMAWEGVKNTVKSSINWIIGKVNDLINAINSVAQRGAGAIGFSAPQIPNVPMLAQGGIVTRPTLAMIGEGGEPEAVIPLSKLGALGGGITININGGNYLSEDAGLMLGDQIIEVLRRNFKI